MANSFGGGWWRGAVTALASVCVVAGVGAAGYLYAEKRPVRFDGPTKGSRDKSFERVAEVATAKIEKQNLSATTVKTRPIRIKAVRSLTPTEVKKMPIMLQEVGWDIGETLPEVAGEVGNLISSRSFAQFASCRAKIDEIVYGLFVRSLYRFLEPLDSERFR